MFLTVLGIGLATGTTVVGSYASWTSQSTNPGSGVTAGTLTMSNDKSAAAVFTATNVKPGDTGSDTVTVGNTGSIPMTVSLTQDTISATGIEASLRVSLYDAGRDYCYFPDNDPGPCVAYGAWSGIGTQAIANASGGAQWAASESHTFTVSWQLLSTSPNADQGKTGSFRLVWDGVQ